MKIQIVTCQFGSGHLSAAQTLKQQIEQARPEDSVELVDLVAMSFPRSHRLIYKTYQSMVLTGAKLVKWVYGENPQKGLSDKPSAINQLVLSNLFHHLTETKPDVVIATYSLATKALARFKQLHPEAFRLVTCITDVQAHAGWINHQTDLYLVACQATKLVLIQHGVKPEQVIVQGIPVKQLEPKAEVSKLPSILLMGGGLGLLPSSEDFYYGLAATGCHVTVVCGKNTKLQKKLQKLNLPNVTVLGYCHHMAQLLKESDIIISKPGGVTTFEAIAAEIPLLAFSPTLPQEQSNARFIEANQLGAVLPKQMKQVPQAIEALMRQPERLNSMRQNMRQFRQGLEVNGLGDYLGRQPCS